MKETLQGKPKGGKAQTGGTENTQLKLTKGIEIELEGKAH